MFDTDFNRFAALLDSIAGMLPNAKPLTPAGKSLFFRTLANLRFDDVERALMAHLQDPQRGRFMPVPADVVAQIEGAAADDGRPGADEAWTTALLASDEAETVVWTEETAQAMFVAQPVLRAGDKVGARMAFKNAYDRLVADARHARRPAHWHASLGQDPARRERALQGAVNRNLLPAPQVAGLLPAPLDADNSVPADVALENTRKLKALLADAISPAEKLRRARETHATAERERLQGLKDDAEALAGEAAVPLWPMAAITSQVLQ
jgi:hypothetical protein